VSVSAQLPLTGPSELPAGWASVLDQDLETACWALDLVPALASDQLLPLEDWDQQPVWALAQAMASEMVSWDSVTALVWALAPDLGLADDKQAITTTH